ncbi:MAG: helix-turn-helix domain-containing protein [Candidatus Magasanikbacteria bacterium]|nr:helix-turn-helix domain-containing protein [Candidatus Magasanikbacteria bacterium]
MSKWSKYLNLLGLADSETTVYLSVLKSGPETVQNIAKNVGLSRVTVYAAIESLTKRGLMTSVEKGKKQFYAVEPPERIISLAENKTSQMQSMIKEIKENIQELKLIQSGDKPVVKMFEGPDAFTAIQEDVLGSKIDLMCEFGNIDEIDRVYPYDKGVRNNFFDRLSKMPMERRLVFVSTDPRPKTNEPNKKIKYLDIEKFKFYGDIFIYNDTLWMSSFKGKQITVMIKSQEIKDTLQAAFDLIWNTLP